MKSSADASGLNKPLANLGGNAVRKGGDVLDVRDCPEFRGYLMGG